MHNAQAYYWNEGGYYLLMLLISCKATGLRTNRISCAFFRILMCLFSLESNWFYWIVYVQSANSKILFQNIKKKIRNKIQLQLLHGKQNINLWSLVRIEKKNYRKIFPASTKIMRRTMRYIESQGIFHGMCGIYCACIVPMLARMFHIMERI